MAKPKASFEKRQREKNKRDKKRIKQESKKNKEKEEQQSIEDMTPEEFMRSYLESEGGEQDTDAPEQGPASSEQPAEDSAQSTD